MSWSFQQSNSVKISAVIDGSSERYSFSGISSDSEITPESAKTQLDKILYIIGKSVKINGMTRTEVQEAADI